ncbi:YHS domain-containing (seleno)protein [uncultured Imperialibacter sp.]|uniref:YHS domain-containing (seleno)protein n=1 Tax=uncultured Imperialibacter sp. TaxID=1672639 RepID=UPI0030DA3EC6|tara:strand:+ start:51108 stop:51572 length:465 start_codon:yes stop_codon:yes gene_type:complete
MKLLIFTLLLFVFQIGVAQDATQRKNNFNLTKNGVALSGYDPVSYFKSPEPKKGEATWSYTYKGITYWFSSASNRSEFVNSPAAYEPSYGGWCAYALGTSGEKVEVDPLTYKIYQGKLLLFYNRLFTNTLTLWNKDEGTFFTTAEKNWPSIINH